MLGAAAAAIRLAALCLPLQITLLSVPGSQRCLRDGCNGAAVRADEHGHTASLHGRIDQQAESCGVTSKARFAPRLQGPHCPHRARACGLDGCVFVCVCVCVCVCMRAHTCVPKRFRPVQRVCICGRAHTHTHTQHTHTHTHSRTHIMHQEKAPPLSLSHARELSLSYSYLHSERAHLAASSLFGFTAHIQRVSQVSENSFSCQIHFLVIYVFRSACTGIVCVSGMLVRPVCRKYNINSSANIILI